MNNIIYLVFYKLYHFFSELLFDRIIIVSKMFVARVTKDFELY